MKNIGRVMVSFLCTSFDDALYFYQVSQKYLEWFLYYGLDTISIHVLIIILKENN